MTTVTVRQSGGAEIVSIPKAIGKALGLHVGSELNLSIVENRDTELIEKAQPATTNKVTELAQIIVK